MKSCGVRPTCGRAEDAAREAQSLGRPYTKAGPRASGESIGEESAAGGTLIISNTAVPERLKSKSELCKKLCG